MTVLLVLITIMYIAAGILLYHIVCCTFINNTYTVRVQRPLYEYILLGLGFLIPFANVIGLGLYLVDQSEYYKINSIFTKKF